MSEDVTFWDAVERPYGSLSNLHSSPIRYDGVVYRSVEHAIKALEALRQEVREWIMAAPTPLLAAIAGGGLPPHEQVPGWSERRLPLMRDLLQSKFTQHAELRDLLLSTGERRIVELAPHDDAINRFWSEVEGSGIGENWLGRLLMDLRGQLKS